MKIFNLLTLALAATSVLAACSPQKSTSGMGSSQGENIVNGQVVGDGAAITKSIVGLMMLIPSGETADSYHVGFCTGSIISDSVVLTAGHCVEEGAKIVLIFSNDLAHGQVNTIPRARLRIADTAVQNPGWISSAHSADDLALLHFTGGLPAGYAPAQMLPVVDVVKPGDTINVAGYGITDEGTDSVGILRQTQIYFAGQSPSGKMAIEDGTRSNVCFGDSGGPAYIQKNGTNFLWGVASSVFRQPPARPQPIDPSTPQAAPTAPAAPAVPAPAPTPEPQAYACHYGAVHTMIAPYMPWILETMKNLQAPPAPVAPTAPAAPAPPIH
jgi:secreted trypsin-like serine protease